MGKYFALSVFLFLVVILGNGCAVAGQRSHVTVYPNSNFEDGKYTQFYSYSSGNSPSGIIFMINQYFEESVNMKSTVDNTKSVDKLFVVYEGTNGAVFPPYFSHVELDFTSINYTKILLLNSMTKQPIIKCIYTRGFFAIVGGGNYQKIIEQSLNEGFEKFKEIQQQRQKDPNKQFPDEITFTVD